MKKLLNFMLAAALICGASVFTSCTNDDNPTNPADNLAEMIIGKWMVADMNGQPAPTNDKMVFTFVSTTKAYVSASLNSHPEVGTHWNDRLEADVTIDGNNVTVTTHPDEHKTVVEVYTVTSIDDKEITANRKITVTVDGNVIRSAEDFFRFVKQTADYSEAVLGTWEG